MGIEKTKLLAYDSLYWIGMNVDIENHIKIVLHTLIFSKPNQKKFIHHDIPGKLWEVIEVDNFTLNNNNLCIVDYHSKFPVVKKAEDLSMVSLIPTCEIIFFRIWFAEENNVR